MSSSLPTNPKKVYASDPLLDELTTSFQSSRLKYVRMDPNDEHIKAFLPQIDKDLATRALASSNMIMPMTVKESDENYGGKSLISLAICLLPTEGATEDKGPTYIGTMGMGFGGISPERAQNRNASLGISLAKPFQNKGYGREALNWLIDWGFKYAGLHTISLTAVEFNAGGLHLYESVGFRLEGRRKEVFYLNRKFYDELDFGMTEQEWEKLRGISN